MPELILPGAVAEILRAQGLRGDIFVNSTAEAVALQLLGSLLIEQRYTNQLLREAAEREKARDKAVQALRGRADQLAEQLRRSREK